MYNLAGKVALVTGAGGEQGMGHSIAIRLAREGADVVVNDLVADPNKRPRSSWGGIHQVVKEIKASGREGLGILADITDSSRVDSMVRQALDRFGRIDILINNAAARQGPDLVPVVDLEEDVWDNMYRVNVKGTFLCSRAVAREMIRFGEGGKIVIISSTAGRQGMGGRAAYCASKFALIGLTQSLALELAQYRINVNAICPGTVDTQRLDYIAAALAKEGESATKARTRYMRERVSSNPMGRLAEAEDIAKMAAFLCSSQADYLTGLAMSVSGGAQMI